MTRRQAKKPARHRRQTRWTLTTRATPRRAANRRSVGRGDREAADGWVYDAKPAEISRIRNISKVQFGKYDLYPWYFSPYPEAFSIEDVIYICEFCLGYYGS